MSFTELQERMAKLSSGGYSRRLRRVLIGLSICSCLISYTSAIIGLHAGRGGGRFYGFASGITALQAVGLAVFWMWLLRRNSSSMSWEDRARMDFGKTYAELSPMHKFDVRVRVAREMRRGGRPADERDALLQHEAERRAFQLLKIALPVFLLVYWAVVCFFMPADAVRVGLVIGGVVLSGVSIPVMILPDLIRLWTEPDDMREMQVAKTATDAGWEA